MPEPIVVKSVTLSSAHDITDESFASYRKTILALPDDGVLGVVKATLSQWYDCVHVWWLHEEVGTDATPHPSGIGEHRKLPTELLSVLRPLVPYEFILVAQREFIGNHITWQDNRELATVAGHLSWYVGELLRGREPIELSTLSADDWKKLKGVKAE